MVAPLVNAVNFFRDFGLFDVILPFLLVFAIVFSILEKTKILGEEKTKKDEIGTPKRSLNAMVAFVSAMLVVATNKVVTTINTALPNVILLVIVIVLFLMLIGVFYKEGDFNFSETHKGWVIGFSIIILIAIILIFLNSLTLANGESWLEWGFNYAINNISGPIVTSIIFLIVMLVAIKYIMKKPA